MIVPDVVKLLSSNFPSVKCTVPLTSVSSLLRTTLPPETFRVEPVDTATVAVSAIELPVFIDNVVLCASSPTFNLLLPDKVKLAVFSISFEVNQFKVPPVIVDSPPKNLPSFTFVTALVED